MAAAWDDAHDASAEVESGRLIRANEDRLIQRRGACGIGRLIALDDEIPGPLGGAKLGVVATSEITGHAIRMVGVIVRQHDVGRPATGELARLTREPLRALRLIEPLDREHRVASDNES